MSDIKLNLGTGSLDFYNPISLKSVPEDELRKEYARLRKTARERIGRIERSWDFGDSQIVRNNKRLLDTPASKVRSQDLRSGLSELASLLSSNLSTLSGLRRHRDITLEHFREAGYEGITKENWNQFTAFMKMTQVFRLAYIPYPKRSASSEARENARSIRPQLFALSQKANISVAAIAKNFEWFINNLDKIQSAVDDGALKAKSRAYSANDVRKALGMESEQGFRSVKQAREAAKAINNERRKKAHKNKS